MATPGTAGPLRVEDLGGLIASYLDANPSVWLSTFGGSTEPNVTLTGSAQTYATIGPLPVGTYRVLVTAQSIGSGAADKQITFTCAEGTATATVQEYSTLAQTLDETATNLGHGRTHVMHGDLYVTAAGTMVLQALSSTANDAEITFVNWTAVRIL